MKRRTFLQGLAVGLTVPVLLPVKLEAKKLIVLETPKLIERESLVQFKYEMFVEKSESVGFEIPEGITLMSLDSLVTEADFVDITRIGDVFHQKMALNPRQTTTFFETRSLGWSEIEEAFLDQRKVSIYADVMGHVTEFHGLITRQEISSPPYHY